MKRLTSGLTEMFGRLTEFARLDVEKQNYSSIKVIKIQAEIKCCMQTYLGSSKKYIPQGGEEGFSPRWQSLGVSLTQRWREAESLVQGLVFDFSSKNFTTYIKVRAKVSSSTVHRSHSVDTILEQKSDQEFRCIQNIFKLERDHFPQAGVWLPESRTTRIYNLQFPAESKI